MRFITIRLKAILTAAALGAALVCGAMFARATDAGAVYWSGARSLPVYSVERDDKKIALTFDCAWGVDATDAILAHLEEAGVRVTFFAVQFWVERYPDYVKKIDAAGHELGTHGATHSYMSRLSEGEIRAELTASSQAIAVQTQKPVTLFRPPYGDYNDRLIDVANDMGLLPVQWDVDSLDWKDLSAAEIVSRVVPRVRSGSIILCHNNGLHTAEALPAMIDALRAKGYVFVPVGELVHRSNYTIDGTGRQQPKGGA